MKIAFDPDVLRQINMPITEMVHTIANMGFQYIEQSPHEQILPFYKHPRASKEIILAYKKALRETGLQISSLIPVYNWSGPEEDRRKAAVKNWKRAIEVAVELDVDVMNSELAGDPSQPVVCEEMLYRSIEELLPIFEREGIRLDIQSHPYDFCENSDETVDIVKSFRSDHIKYLYCAAHTFFYDNGIGDTEKMLSYAGKDLKHVIIADTYNHTRHCRYIVNPPGVRATVHQHTPLGEGEVNFEAMFRKLREMKFGEQQDTIAAVSLFGFPDKLKQFKEVKKRIERELL